MIALVFAVSVPALLAGLVTMERWSAPAEAWVKGGRGRP